MGDSMEIFRLFGRVFLEDSGVTRGLNNIERRAEQTAQNLNKLVGVAKGVGLAIAGFLTGATAGKIIDINANFEKLTTSMTSLTGSSAKAKIAMAWVTDFAQKTPYEVNQVTEAFIKLGNYGLSAPKLLQPLGDAAGALGKDLNAAVEMIADASQMEFERLKEFGIRATQKGDEVKLKWTQNGKEMTKTVKKDSGEVVNALTGILSKYKGGMEAQSKTWNGLWSNMMDKLDSYIRLFTGGMFGSAKQAVDSLLKKLEQLEKDGTIARWAFEAKQYVEKLVEKLKWVWKHSDDIVTIGKIFFVVWSVTKIASITNAVITLANSLRTAAGAAEALNLARMGGIPGLVVAGAAVAGYGAYKWYQNTQKDAKEKYGVQKVDPALMKTLPKEAAQSLVDQSQKLYDTLTNMPNQKSVLEAYILGGGKDDKKLSKKVKDQVKTIFQIIGPEAGQEVERLASQIHSGTAMPKSAVDQFLNALSSKFDANDKVMQGKIKILKENMKSGKERLAEIKKEQDAINNLGNDTGTTGTGTTSPDKDAEKLADKIANVNNDLKAALNSNAIKEKYDTAFSRAKEDLVAYKSALDKMIELDPKNKAIDFFKKKIGELSATVNLQKVHELFKSFDEEMKNSAENVRLFNPELLNNEYEEAKRISEETARELNKVNDMLADETIQGAARDELKGKKARLQADYDINRKKQLQYEEDMARYARYGENKQAVDEVLEEAQANLNNITKLSSEELENYANKLMSIIPLDQERKNIIMELVNEFREQEKAINADLDAEERYKAYGETMKKIPEILASAKAKLAEMKGENFKLPEWEQLAQTLEDAAEVAPEFADELNKVAKSLREVGKEAENLSTLKNFFSTVGSTFKIGNITDGINSLIDNVPKIKDAYANVQGRGGFGAIFDKGQNGGLLGGLGTIASFLGPAGGIVSAATSIFGGLFGGGDAAKKAEEERKRQAIQSYLQPIEDFFGKSMFVKMSDHMARLVEEYRATGNEAGKAFMEKFMDIAKGLESGITSGLTNGIKGFFDNKPDWMKTLRDGIKGAIQDAIINAAVQGAVFKGAFGSLLSQLTEGLASGQDVSGLIGQIAAKIPELTSKIQTSLTPIRDTINSSFKQASSIQTVSQTTYAPVTNATNNNKISVSINAAGKNASQLWDDMVGELDRRGVKVVLEPA